MLELGKEHFEELKEFYLNNELSKFNITDSVKLWCMKHKVEYNDSLRRKGSKILRRGLGDIAENQSPEAKILLFDIETSPLKVYSWGLWNQNIQHTNILQDWKILTFSAKWLFSDETTSFRLSPEELRNFDDSRIAKELWKLLDEADIVIGHNSNKFDIRKANQKFLEHKLPPPTSYHSIDTLYHARKRFAFSSNRLDYLGAFLGFGGKIETSFGMWNKVMDGDYEALIEMDDYCKRDVQLLEDVYLTMRSYIQPHPNVGLFVTANSEICPSCGSTNLSNTHKDYTTTVNVYETYRCNDCQSLSRSRKPIKIDSQNILSSLPR